VRARDSEVRQVLPGLRQASAIMAADKRRLTQIKQMSYPR
jgi:hypothetical protein